MLLYKCTYNNMQYSYIIGYQYYLIYGVKQGNLINMEENMFCNQCQETVNNIGCTVMGVCGKTDKLAGYMDGLKNRIKVIAKITKEKELEGFDITFADTFIMDTLFILITNANFDEEVLKNRLEVESIEVEKRLTGKEVAINLKEEIKKGNQKNIEVEDLRAIREIILNGIMGIAAYNKHCQSLNVSSSKISSFIRNTLAKLIDNLNLLELIQLLDETGKSSVAVMKLLDEANTSSFGNPTITKVSTGVEKQPGILITGHDLSDIKELLEQSKGSGVDIYTHSEMLPAHYYPELKKFDNLVGNYGGAWFDQTTTFETFNGPIIFTTNCLVPPKKTARYNDRVYTTGITGMPQWSKVPFKENNTKDFSEIIEHAKKCSPPDELENGTITGGFAHNQVLDLADKIVDAVKSGAIKKFIVMAGCDGRQKSREYYTEFAKALPEDTVILTAGCAKYRYIKLDLGDINGIPRVLDAGQCNDSYSLIVIAMKLAEIFQCEINELPIVFNIAWYEQKAITVLIGLLHLGVKNITIGPTLPGFLSKNTTDFLVSTFGLSVISSVEEDITRMIKTGE